MYKWKLYTNITELFYFLLVISANLPVQIEICKVK
jgi:hypothetical protein